MASFASNAEGMEVRPRLVEYFAVIGASSSAINEVDGGLIAEVIDRYPLTDHEGKTERVCAVC